MIYDIRHPLITFSDWQTFCKESSPSLIADVIDRSDADLPDWFVPLACGVAIASYTLLSNVGYRQGSHRPRGWRKTHCDVFEQNIGPGGLWGPKCLVVRGCGTQQLWTVERWGDERLYDNSDEVLVSMFGSPPIFTRSYQSAMRLAAYCHANGPPAGLCWTAACPDDKDGAIKFARKRRIDEAHCAVNS